MSMKSVLKRAALYILRGVPVKNISASISYLAPSRRLEGKRIVVTGGGRGLGFAMAQKFAAEGAEVLIAGRNEATLRESSAKLSCKYIPFDAENEAEIGSFMRQADQMLGGANCLVNNAGISLHEGDIRNVSFEGFDAQMGTNLRGGYFLAQKFIEIFERDGRKNGSILFLSSERGIYADDLPYGLTKAAVNSLTRGLARRVITSGLRVNAVAPGITASDMTGFASDGNLFLGCNASERLYLPEEVAEVACFLLSDASGCLSGQILTCNEGKSGNAHWD